MNLRKFRTLQRWTIGVAIFILTYFLVYLIPKPWVCCRNQSNDRIARMGFGLLDDLARDVKDESRMLSPEPGPFQSQQIRIDRMFPIYSKENYQPQDKTSEESRTQSETYNDSHNGSKSAVKVFKLQNFDFTNFSRVWLNENGNQKQRSGPQNQYPYLKQNSVLKQTNFRISDLRQRQKLPDCVKLTVPRDAWTTKICVHYPKDDNFISNRLRDTGEWEMEFTSQMDRFFRKNPNSQLVDLGCNIGVFTLFAASMGKPALALDVLPSNLALIQLSIATNDEIFDQYDKPDDVHNMLQSLGYNRETRTRYSDLITTLHNAVHSRHKKMYVYLKEDLNLGGTEVKEFDGSSDDFNNKYHNSSKLKMHESTQNTAKNRHKILVDAICLDDLIPYVRANLSVFLKMDIEGSEPDALLCAGKFFMYVDVKVILMEMLFNKRTKKGEKMIKFLLRHGMLPARDANGHGFLESDSGSIRTWPENIFWIKVW